MYDRILVTLLKMHPRYSQSSRENATPSRGTSPLASYKEVTPSPRGVYCLLETELFINTNYYKILGKSLGNSM